MEAFLLGVAVTSFVAMVLMATRGVQQQPQPVIFAAQPEPSGGGGWLGLVFVIFIGIVFVMALLLNQ